jgi:hypothetical protein
LKCLGRYRRAWLQELVSLLGAQHAQEARHLAVGGRGWGHGG